MLIKKKKEERFKELENRYETQRKASSLIFLKLIFWKEEKKT